MASNSKTEDPVNWLAELLEKVSLNTFDVGSKCWVQVTHIDNPHSFYVLPTDYQCYLKDLEAEGDYIEANDLSLGSTITYWSKALQKYIRGQVTFKDPEKNKYTLFALDYGFTSEKVRLKYIRKVRETNALPPLALHCKLANCKPKGENFSKEAIDAMKFYVNNKYVSKNLKMYIRESRQQLLTVELINTENIAEILAMTGFTTMGYTENTINRFTTKPAVDKVDFTFFVEKFELGDIINVRVQSGKSADCFFVADVNNYRKYLENQNDFTYYCQRFAKNLHYKEVEIYKPVALRTNPYMKFERAIITKVLSKDKVEVQLVDWGTFVEYPFDYLKVIDREYFFEYPAVAIYCSKAEDSKPIDLALGLEFSLQIKEVGEGLHKPNVVVKVE